MHSIFPGLADEPKWHNSLKEADNVDNVWWWLVLLVRSKVTQNPKFEHVTNPGVINVSAARLTLHCNFKRFAETSKHWSRQLPIQTTSSLCCDGWACPVSPPSCNRSLGCCHAAGLREKPKHVALRFNAASFDALIFVFFNDFFKENFKPLSDQTNPGGFCYDWKT